MGQRWRLRDSVRVDVRYGDDTPYGSAVGGRIEREIAARTGPILRRPCATAATSLMQEPALLDSLFAMSCLGGMYDTKTRLKAECVYPDPRKVVPVALELSGDADATVPIPATLRGDLAPLLGEWERGHAAPLAGPALALWGALSAANCFTESERETSDIPLGVTYVGHATVLVRTAAGSVVIDPYHCARSSEYPAGYQPFRCCEFRADAALLTHSHPDHYDLGALLRLGSDTAVYVPEVPRESLLSIDMAARLRELGFRNVRSLRWGESVRIGGLDVSALPFYGEQPTEGEQLHDDVRNCGNLYTVRDGRRTYAFIADAGRDAAGDVKVTASRERERMGAVDVLFGGYRAWQLYPVQYLYTSVSRYLLFVPEPSRRVRQSIMNGVDDLLDVAERWEASHVIPYANGGAPWYWSYGLGPALDGSQPVNWFFDPPPEAVLRAARARSLQEGVGEVASPVNVRIVRPGQSLSQGGTKLRQVWNGGRSWPYDGEIGRRHPEGLSTFISSVESLGIARKKALLRIVARSELDRLQIRANLPDVQALLDDLRRNARIEEAEEFDKWRQSAGFDVEELTALLCEWARIVQLEQHYEREVDVLAAQQVRLASMRDWRTQHR